LKEDGDHRHAKIDMPAREDLLEDLREGRRQRTNHQSTVVDLH
jgi:hypothetical protein